MKNIFLILNTIKYLKFQQIYYRLIRYVIKPKVRQNYKGFHAKRSQSWKHLGLYEDKIKEDMSACFINHSKVLSLPHDWNNESHSKLWAYNLNYFEDLISKNAHIKNNFHQKLLNLWVDENKIGLGNGWEAYPTSLRIVNILKAWLGGLELNNKLLSSLFSQASYLSNNLEKHLLGNHYFSNLKALLFAGIIFENHSWINVAEKGLATEIPEQILNDGANFELSPMYHSQILVDMLDMYNLCRSYPDSISIELPSLIKSRIPKMLAFMEAISHPDNGVSFFNDSVDGVTPAKTVIEDYAILLGFKINQLDLTESKIIDFAESGYFCAIQSGSKLLFDASPIGPDYIPGHAHADTLSFELSIGKQRVFVNSGISEYGSGINRINQRKTKSHNTVEIDGKDSTEVWSSFRVANRAKIINRNSDLSHKESIILEAAHDGYRKFFNNCIHSRKLTLHKNTLHLYDEIKGKFNFANSYLYFHSSLDVTLEKNLLKVIGPDFIIKSNLVGMNASLNDSYWNPQFGISIPNKVLEIEFKKNYLEIVFNWNSL